MIKIAKGNLLNAAVDALVNTVNTEGVMGKGIALQFKRAYPDVFDKYEEDCKHGKVQVGSMHVVDLGALGGGPRWVINFPTKRHWRAKSRIADIEAGLDDLVDKIEELQIRSIALPPLGCGHGGLDWKDVYPAIEKALGSLATTEVLVFPPVGTPAPTDMPNRTVKPSMTASSAAVVTLINQYQQGLLTPFIRLLEVHKLMYFLQEAGENLKLNYTGHTYGPYASNLRHVLSRVEGHWISGYGDGQDAPTKELELISGAVDAASDYLDGRFDTKERMERVADLIEGFEDPYGLELLSSVHWVMCNCADAANSVDTTIAAVHGWNSRKATMMKKEHIATAWNHLKSKKWDSESRSARSHQTLVK